MELRDVQAALRSGIESRAKAVGPFLVLLNQGSAHPFHNYAVPVDGAAPTAQDVAALVTYFHSRDRLPRLEYVRPSPAADTALVHAGFDVAATLTLMALDEFVPPPPPADGYRIELVTDEATLRQAAAAQNAAFGEPDADTDPSGLLRTVSSGGAVAVARSSAEVVGAGAHTPPQRGLVEIGGVGVRRAHRRQGLGRLVTSALTTAAVTAGHQPFLQVEKDEPARLYQRIGYRVIGEMVDARLNGRHRDGIGPVG
jgi:ribosomal protein S18 acetylase RimI-like enzyme